LGSEANNLLKDKTMIQLERAIKFIQDHDCQVVFGANFIQVLDCQDSDCGQTIIVDNRVSLREVKELLGY